MVKRITSQRTQIYIFSGTEDRSDIVYFNSESGQDVELDITLAYGQPWSIDTIRRAGENNGYAASKREDKIDKYNHKVLPDGCKHFLIPLCLSTLGGGASPANCSWMNCQRSLGQKEGEERNRVS